MFFTQPAHSRRRTHEASDDHVIAQHKKMILAMQKQISVWETTHCEDHAAQTALNKQIN